MELLVDTDAFYKLGLCGLVERVAAALGSSASETRRLPALPHMLKRGGLAKRLGPENAAALQTMASAFNPLSPPSEVWLAKMTGLPNIDPGEALLFAACIEEDGRVLTGDKRAIRAVAAVDEIKVALTGRLVTMEAALLALGQVEDLTELKADITPAMQHDSMLRVCFSEGADPRAALDSYLRSFVAEVGAELLWMPATGSGDPS